MNNKNNPFKVGDIVECIDGFECMGGPQRGKRYKVISINYRWIGVECPELSSYYSKEVRDGTLANWGHKLFKLTEERPLPEWF